MRNLTITGDGTFKMWKKDYMDPALYVKGEWRMGLKIVSAERVRVEGISIVSSGGDGIYIAGGHQSAVVSSDNVHIKGVTLDDNYRQGISVIVRAPRRCSIPHRACFSLSRAWHAVNLTRARASFTLPCGAARASLAAAARAHLARDPRSGRRV